MRKSVKKFASLILIGFSFSAFAQNKENSKNSEVVKLSIEEAVDYALKNSRTLKFSK